LTVIKNKSFINQKTSIIIMGEDEPARVYVLKTSGRSSSSQCRDPVIDSVCGPNKGHGVLSAGISRSLPGGAVLPRDFEEELETMWHESKTCQPKKETPAPPTRDNPMPALVDAVEYWSQAVFDQRLEEMNRDPYQAAIGPFRIWLSRKQLDDMGIDHSPSRPAQLYVRSGSIAYVADICITEKRQSGVRLSQCLADVLYVRENASIELYVDAVPQEPERSAESDQPTADQDIEQHMFIMPDIDTQKAHPEQQSLFSETRYIPPGFKDVSTRNQGSQASTFSCSWT
jgi:hypothetical protein